MQYLFNNHAARYGLLPIRAEQLTPLQCEDAVVKMLNLIKKPLTIKKIYK